MEDTSSSVGREKKIGVFVSKQMIPIVLLIVFIASVDGSYENMSTENPSKASNEVVIVQDAFIVEWQVNHTSQTIQFDASVAIDEKGWFLLGFMSPNNNSANITTKLTTIADTNGDVVLNWPVSASKRKTLDCNTMNITGNLTQDNHQDYRVEKLPSYNNSSSNVSSFRITRKLDTSDPSDVPFTNASLWIFGAYGTSNTSFAQLEEFVQVIGNTLQFTEVKLMEKKPDAEDKNPQDHYMFIEEVKKHWMTVIMAVAAVVSLVIVGVVYCCFRKGGIKKKKTLSKTFYREVADEDDEARVAFLHSRT